MLSTSIPDMDYKVDLASDTALLRSFPGTTSASLAAFAISRAVCRSVQSPLPPDALDAARNALSILSSSPEPPAVAGLVDAVEHGALASGVDAFVLTAGAWRVLLALADVVHDAQIAARILGAAALSSLAVLAPASASAEAGAAPAAKRIRIARFHAVNGARFARAFLVSVPDPTTTDAFMLAAATAADLFGAVALHIARNSDGGAHSLSGPVAALLAGAFRFVPSEKWAAALSQKAVTALDETAQRRVAVVLYLTHLARSEPPHKDFTSLCSGALRSHLLPFLFHLLETQGSTLLSVRITPTEPSLAVVLASTLSDVATHLAGTQNCNEKDETIAFLLEQVSSSSLFVSATASRALLSIVSSQDSVTSKRILQSVRDAYRLSVAIRSPHSVTVWKPLLETMEDELLKKDSSTKALDLTLGPEAKKFAELERANDASMATALIASIALKDVQQIIKKHSNRIAVPVVRVCVQCSEGTTPPVQAVELTKCALDSANSLSALRRASALHHARQLLRNLPISVHRNSLESMIANIRQQTFAPRHLHDDKQGNVLLKGLHHAIARLSRTIGSTTPAQVRENTNPMNETLEEQLCTELPNILCAVRFLQIAASQARNKDPR